MKYYLIFLVFLCFTSFQSFSQSSKHFSYLIITIHSRYDNVNEKGYYSIQAEEGDSIIALINYSAKQRTKKAVLFYGALTDTAKIYFNYFASTSQALQYLDERGWQVLTIISSISRYDGNIYNILYTTPVYYLRKERN